ncbi:MAG: CsiV family protein [Wenzhouxiangella sp.]
MKAFLISSILGLTLALSPQAHGRLFLVEVIVIGHPDGRSDQRASDQLRDFSDLLDPAWIARLSHETSSLSDDIEAVEPGIGESSSTEGVDESSDAPPAAPRPAQRPTARLIESGMPEDLARWLEQSAPLYPVTFSNQTSLGPEMSRAWQRIDNNPGFEALAWRAWIQPIERGQRSPAVRIHDERVIEGSWATPFELPEGLVAPWPQSQFRLDGSLRLVQRQFLHAEIDLDWRTPAAGGGLDEPPPLLASHRYRVHRLEQSRTIRPERLEYFDSSKIGVLLRIQRWDSD